MDTVDFEFKHASADDVERIADYILNFVNGKNIYICLHSSCSA